MAVVIRSIRNWATSHYLNFRRWVRGSGSAKLIVGLIVAVTFVSSLALIILEMRSSANLMGELDRGLRADAAALAYHLERLTLEILTEERRAPEPGSMAPASRPEQKVKIAPEEVLTEVLPRAYARLAESIREPGLPRDAALHGRTWLGMPGPFELGVIDPAGFVFEIETPLGRFRVGDQGRSSGPKAARVQTTDTLSRPFGLAGLLSGWILHVGFRNRLKKAREVRYLARVFLLTIIFMGSVLAYRVMHRQVDLARARSVFVSNVSHELKTPLSAIRLYNSLLGEMDPDDTEHGEFHQVIEHEVVRLSAMIDNVLDFSHMEQGHMRLSLMEVDLGSLLGQTLQMFRRLYEDRGYHFALVAGEALPVVYADPDALQQVIANLLDNAVKYSDPHTIWVQVHVAHRSARRFVVVNVEDQGIGIDRDKQHRVFEPFYRSESGLAQRVSGSGLGLAVAKFIVKAHKGHVELESTPGRGTTFRVLLPAESLAEPDVADTS